MTIEAQRVEQYKAYNLLRDIVECFGIAVTLHHGNQITRKNHGRG